MRHLLWVVLLLTMVSAKVLAEGYVGISYGQTDFDISVLDFDKGNGIGLRAGYQINNYTAIEGSYIDSGKADDNDGSASWYLEGETLQIGARVSTDISNPFQAYIKAGYAFWDFDLDQTNTGQGTESDDGNDLFYGIGLAYSAGNAHRFFLEFQTLEADDTDIDTTSIGYEYRF